MEKTVKFHVLKEKIIKTNELLQLHLEKTRELEKTQKCYHQLKTTLELSRNEIKKLKLRNETLSCNLQLTEKKHAPLKDDYNKLKQQFSKLEDESSKTINNLQINYQLVSQELKECKEKLASIDEPVPIEVKPKSPTKRKKTPPRDANLNQKINQLTVENERLSKENEAFKWDMYKLKKKLDNSRGFQGDVNQLRECESKLRMTEQELFELKIKLKSSEEMQAKEIDRLTKELENFNKLTEEIEKVKNENCSYRIEISMLQQNDKQNEIDKIKEEKRLLIAEINELKEIIRESNNTPSDEQISIIMTEIVPPDRISPMLDDEKMPDNLSCVPFKPQRTFVSSSSGNFRIYPFMNCSNILKRRKRSVRKKRKTKKVDLLGTLRALKDANINFVISNDTLLQDITLKPAVTGYRAVFVPKKKPKTYICKLKCSLTCCKSCDMLLKGGTDQDAPLLGFVNVKDEDPPKLMEFLTETTFKKPVLQTRRSSRLLSKQSKISEEIATKAVQETVKDDQATFKRPLCIRRRSSRLVPIESKITEISPKGVLEITRDDALLLESPTETTFKRPICQRKRSPLLGPLQSEISEEISPEKVSKESSNNCQESLPETPFKKTPCRRKPAVVSTQSKISEGIVPKRIQEIATDDGLAKYPESLTSDSGIINPNINPLEASSTQSEISEEIAPEREQAVAKETKTRFKRPVVRTRRSLRLESTKSGISEEIVPKGIQEITKDVGRPKSPASENTDCGIIIPKIIALGSTSSQSVFDEMATDDGPFKCPQSPTETRFKRSVCRTRQSSRSLFTCSERSEEVAAQGVARDDDPPMWPESPSSEDTDFGMSEPKIIPLEATSSQSEIFEKMATADSPLKCPQSPTKTRFKRSVCRRRQSSRSLFTYSEISEEVAAQGVARYDDPPMWPKSPSSEDRDFGMIEPKIIPLEATSERSKISEETAPDDAPESLARTRYKRPVCITRRSSRSVSTHSEISEEAARDDGPRKCPESFTAENKVSSVNIIPSEAPTSEKRVGNMPTTKVEVLFVKLINYSMEEEVLNEVVQEFSKQNPEYIAHAILEKVSQDYHEPADSKYSPAPLMTATQRTMLGFMSKLEKSNVEGVFDSYLTLAERKLLTCQKLEEFAPVTRLYLAVCKLHQNIERMRKLCCEVFYFCGDFAVPFLFCVLTSWTEVLPSAANSAEMPLAKVLVQIVYMKECNKPGYNLNPLRDLLVKFYGYPTERWDSNKLFQELFNRYLWNPTRSSEFALLLLCQNHSSTWVHERVEQHFKPIVGEALQENFKAAVIIFIGNLYSRSSSKSEPNYSPVVREWLSSLITETTPDLVKASLYLCLNRLPKK